MHGLPFLLVLILPVLVVLGVAVGGGWTFLGAAFVYGGIPILDRLGGLDTHNADGPRGGLFDVPLVLWVPLQAGATVFVLYRVASGDLSVTELLGVVISMGAVNGAGGINVAHELMHRTGSLARGTAEVLLYGVSYPQFVVEHVLGHHRHVATPVDSAFSRAGDGLYRFVVRSACRSLLSAWRIETARVKKRGIVGLRDRRLRYPLLQVSVWALVAVTLGPLALLVFLAQSAVAIFLLETINYLEHYGLERREISPGRYERVRPEHSWNASQRVSNWLLFNLQRHSDDHYLASRPYQDLRHYDDVPQLPAGYSLMILVAFVPPLWFRIMDPRVKAWNDACPGPPAALAA